MQSNVGQSVIVPQDTVKIHFAARKQVAGCQVADYRVGSL